MQAAPTTLAEFPFQFREGLLWIEVTVPQSEKPLNFLVDSGAGVSVINLSTAKQLGLKLGRKVPVQGVHTKLTGYWQQKMSARIDDVPLPSRYLAVDLEKLSRSCQRPVDGLVGADFFRGRVVQIDFDAEKIRILKKANYGNCSNSLPLQMRTCGMRVPIAVDGIARQWMRLDTGCASALQWVTSDMNPVQCGQQMAIGLTDISIPQALTTVDLGTQTINKVPTGLHDTAIFPGESGLIGNGLLSHFSSITIDAKTGHLILGTISLPR